MASAASLSAKEKCMAYTFQLVGNAWKALVEEMRMLGLAFFRLHTHHAMSGTKRRNSHKKPGFARFIIFCPPFL